VLGLRLALNYSQSGWRTGTNLRRSHLIKALTARGFQKPGDVENRLGYYLGQIILPGNTHHFHWAKSGEYVTQITALGPPGLEYLNAKDDPRNSKS
jgi:hypothetical protein